MDEQDIKKILKIVLEALQGRKVNWYLTGSANLKVQGIDVSVKDLDITTDDVGIKIFKEALKKFVVKDFFNQKINSNSLICDIYGFEVEINSYKDKELQFLDKTKNIFWNGLEIPILPLSYAKKFYELINKKDKVRLIENYLSS